eukprot:14624353-Heterocapsa_arctica.AAC.1
MHSSHHGANGMCVRQCCRRSASDGCRGHGAARAGRTASASASSSSPSTPSGASSSVGSAAEPPSAASTG